MIVKDSVRMKEILREMEISHPTVRQRIEKLLDGRYKVDGLNCFGTALFVIGRLNKPVFVSCHRDSMMSYVNEAKVVHDKKCGDLIICHGVPEDSTNYLHHAVVYLGLHNSRDLVFHKGDVMSPFYIEPIASAMTYCHHSTIYRFDGTK